MKFAIIEVNWKEDWSRYKNHIKWAIERGLIFQKEMGGDHFGNDAKYMIMTEDIIDEETCKELIKAGAIDISLMDYKDEYTEEEWTEIEKELLLKSYEDEDHENYKYTTLKLLNGNEHILIYPNDYTGLHE